MSAQEREAAVAGVVTSSANVAVNVRGEHVGASSFLSLTSIVKVSVAVLAVVAKIRIILKTVVHLTWEEMIKQVDKRHSMSFCNCCHGATDDTREV